MPPRPTWLQSRAPTMPPDSIKTNIVSEPKQGENRVEIASAPKIGALLIIVTKIQAENTDFRAIRVSFHAQS